MGMENKPSNADSTAILGGGCFWCLEAVYQRVDGVVSVVPGYAGGQVANPTYEGVCSGDTGHAEVVKISYDSSKIDFKGVLDWFWRCHDPTQLNRQGNDVGTQYRSAIFYVDEAQRALAEKTKAEQQSVWGKPVVTEISPAPKFWEAEDYHHDYFNKHPWNGYCQVVIRPKLHKLGI